MTRQNLVAFILGCVCTVGCNMVAFFVCE